MKLQTNISLTPQENQIDYTSEVILVGSCFTENIGGKLDYFKFQNVQNPFGIIFHPLEIEKLVHRAVTNNLFTGNDVFERDGQWYCFEAHSSITATSKDKLLVLLNQQLQEFSRQIKQATHFVFTFGTAWVYRYLASDLRVANCHKLPQKNFKKEILSVEEISESINNTTALLYELNPKAIIILTVSPVRHLKDGFVENSRSKAHLLAGIHHSIPTLKAAQYFPSYEIMMDELRDYRFYADDMIHPNNTAIEYIWEKFQLVWISNSTTSLQKQVDDIQKGLQHRPFNSTGKAYQEFKENLDAKIRRLKEKLPNIAF